MIVGLRTLGLAGAALVLLAGPAGAESFRVTVRASEAITAETIVAVPIEAAVPPGVYALKTAANDPGATAEVYKDRGRTTLVLPITKLDKEGEAAFTMTAATAVGRAVRARGPNLEVVFGASPFTEYRVDDGPKPYYFPVIGPTGARFTRAYPMEKVAGEDADHPHQRSLWFTHGNVNGLDFWASDPNNKPNPKFGAIKETSRTIVHNGGRSAVVRTTDDWLGPDGKPVCEDERVVGFHQSPGGEVRLIDFDVTIKASHGPVTFGDTKEGTFGVRVASSMDVKNKPGGKITNAEGLTDDDAWGKASPWVDYTGPVEGRTVGIAILNHPDSFRYPTTWHVRTYGLFAANPFGWHDFGQKQSGAHTVPDGESIRFRYRVVFHKGDTTSARVPSAFGAFAHPPTITVRPE